MIKYLFTMLLVLLAQVSLATTFQLQLEDFGTAPTDTMECVRGACDTDSTKRIITSSYVNPQDPNQFYGYDITPPRYDYYNDELFRVSFKIKTDNTAPEFYLEAIEAALVDHYDMEWLGEDEHEINANLLSHVVGYSSDSGIIVHIYWEKRDRCWSAPSIRIQKTELIDQLNKDMNPDYIPPGNRLTMK